MLVVVLRRVDDVSRMRGRDQHVLVHQRRAVEKVNSLLLMREQDDRLFSRGLTTKSRPQSHSVARNKLVFAVICSLLLDSVARLDAT
jgi:hypothetical protein